jgi:hypothetical protein
MNPCLPNNILYTKDLGGRESYPKRGLGDGEGFTISPPVPNPIDAGIRPCQINGCFVECANCGNASTWEYELAP